MSKGMARKDHIKEETVLNRTGLKTKPMKHSATLKSTPNEKRFTKESMNWSDVLFHLEGTWMLYSCKTMTCV